MDVENVLEPSEFRGQPDYFRSEQLSSMQMNNGVFLNVLYKPEEKVPNYRCVGKLEAFEASYTDSILDRGSLH